MRSAEYIKMRKAEDAHWWYVALHEKVLRTVLAGARSGGRLLDAGCGTGRLLELLGPHLDAEGLEFSEAAVEITQRRGVKASRADLNHAELGSGRYDVLTCIDVLCQRGIADEVHLLRRFYRALRPGGLLIVNVPAYKFMRGPHDLAVNAVRRYTKSRLTGMIEAAGFSVEYATYRVCALFPAILAWRVAGRMLGLRGSDVNLPPRLINHALLALMRLENRIPEAVPLPFGSSVFAVGRRP